MMIVMPALAVADDEPIPAILIGFVIAITPEVGHRVDGPGDVPHHHRADEHAPDQQAEPGSNTIPVTSVGQRLSAHSCGGSAGLA